MNIQGSSFYEKNSGDFSQMKQGENLVYIGKLELRKGKDGTEFIVLEVVNDEREKAIAYLREDNGSAQRYLHYFAKDGVITWESYHTTLDVLEIIKQKIYSMVVSVSISKTDGKAYVNSILKISYNT